jgi:hypothetical protein
MRYENRTDFDNALANAWLIEPEPINPEDVYFDKNQPFKVDDDYKTTVLWDDVFFDFHFDCKAVEVLKRMFREEFDLQYDIRWIGIVGTFKTPGDPDSFCALDAAFLVHNDDKIKISNSHRLKLGFGWIWDFMCGQASRRYPMHFRRMYRNY